MKKVLVSAVVLSFMLAAGVAGQNASDELKDFTRVLKGDGLQLTLIHVNSKTLPVLFQPPTLYAMRARAGSFTLLYVQGTPDKDVNLDTTNFVATQGGESIVSTPANITHFQTGKAAKGERIDGLLQFAKQLDLTKPFKIVHGKDSVEFKFNDRQIADMSAPAAPSQQ